MEATSGSLSLQKVLSMVVQYPIIGLGGGPVPLIIDGEVPDSQAFPGSGAVMAIVFFGRFSWLGGWYRTVATVLGVPVADKALSEPAFSFLKW